MGTDQTVYRVARTRKELEDGFSLVYKEYASKGYIPKDYKSKLRVSFFNALPKTTTFVAVQDKKVVASVTLIPDSPLGIPMDKLYKAEVDKLRKKGCRVAEASQLSIDTKLFGKGFFSMFNFDKLIFIFRLFKLVMDHALSVDGVTDFCIAINPKQQHLYKFLGFEQIGPLKYYGSVNQAPALAFRLKLEGLSERMKARGGVHKIFFGKSTDPELFKGKYMMKPEDLKYFFVKKSDLFKKATRDQMKVIRACYPKAKFDKNIER